MEYLKIGDYVETCHLMPAILEKIIYVNYQTDERNELTVYPYDIEDGGCDIKNGRKFTSQIIIPNGNVTIPDLEHKITTSMDFYNKILSDFIFTEQYNIRKDLAEQFYNELTILFKNYRTKNNLNKVINAEIIEGNRSKRRGLYITFDTENNFRQGDYIYFDYKGKNKPFEINEIKVVDNLFNVSARETGYHNSKLERDHNIDLRTLVGSNITMITSEEEIKNIRYDSSLL